MTQKKVVDERIVHEVGQVYRIAYYLFNAVVGLDLMIKSCVDRIPSGMADSSTSASSLSRLWLSIWLRW